MGIASSKPSHVQNRSKNLQVHKPQESRPVAKPISPEQPPKAAAHPAYIPPTDDLPSNPPSYSSVSIQNTYQQPSSAVSQYTSRVLVGPMLPLPLLLSTYDDLCQYSFDELASLYSLSKYHDKKLVRCDLAHYIQNIHSFFPNTASLHTALAAVSTRFPFIRGVARDGDCFYRSVLVVLVEQLRYLALHNPPRAYSLLKHIASLRKYIVEVSGELCDELWEVFVETLCAAAGVGAKGLMAEVEREGMREGAEEGGGGQGVGGAPARNSGSSSGRSTHTHTTTTAATSIPQSTPWTFSFQNDPHRALSCLSMLRLLTSARLRHDTELQLYVDEEIEFHCKTQVEPLHHDADHVHMTALLRMLCLCVRVCVVTAQDLQVMVMPQGHTELLGEDASDPEGNAFWENQNSGRGLFSGTDNEQKTGAEFTSSSSSSAPSTSTHQSSEKSLFSENHSVSESSPVHCGCALLFLPGHYEIVYPAAFAAVLDGVDGQ